MGLETALILGAALFTADQQIRQSEKQAKAEVEAADIQNKERAKRTKALAARQKVSFLQSGLALEGTPMAAVQGVFDTGIEDINLASRNANTRASNIVSQGRSAAIGTLMSTGASMFAGGMGMTGQSAGQLDIGGDLKGINVPFTGQSASFSQNGTIIPPSKPTRINF